MVEEPVEAQSAVKAPTGTFKVLVRTSNSNALQASTVIKPGRTRNMMVRSQIFIDDRTFSKVFKTTSSQEDIQKEKLLALHESIRASLLDELKQFRRVHWTTDPASIEDVRYTLDYVANSYSVGKNRDQQQFKLGTAMLLIMKDVPGNEEVLKKWAQRQCGLRDGRQFHARRVLPRSS